MVADHWNHSVEHDNWLSSRLCTQASIDWFSCNLPTKTSTWVKIKYLNWILYRLRVRPNSEYLKTRFLIPRIDTVSHQILKYWDHDFCNHSLVNGFVDKVFHFGDPVGWGDGEIFDMTRADSELIFVDHRNVQWCATCIHLAGIPLVMRSKFRCFIGATKYILTFNSDGVHGYMMCMKAAKRTCLYAHCNDPKTFARVCYLLRYVETNLANFSITAHPLESHEHRNVSHMLSISELFECAVKNPRPLLIDCRRRIHWK